jgi:hypothetical protein
VKTLTKGGRFKFTLYWTAPCHRTEVPTLGSSRKKTKIFNIVSGPLWYLKDKSFGRSDDFPVDTKVVRPNGDVARYVELELEKIFWCLMQPYNSLEYVQVGSRRFEKVWEDAVFHVDRRK